MSQRLVDSDSLTVLTFLVKHAGCGLERGCGQLSVLQNDFQFITEVRHGKGEAVLRIDNTMLIQDGFVRTLFAIGDWIRSVHEYEETRATRALPAAAPGVAGGVEPS